MDERRVSEGSADAVGAGGGERKERRPFTPVPSASGRPAGAQRQSLDSSGGGRRRGPQSTRAIFFL